MNCACGNAARYIDETGAFTCSLCPLIAGRDSIKLASVPALLAWVRRFVGDTAGCTARVSSGQERVAELRSVIGTKPQADRKRG